MMRPGCRHRKAPNGFTLLEILLAIVIIGTVLSTVFASYTSSFRIIQNIETQLDVYEMARTTLDRFVEDLESVYVPVHPTTGEDEEDERVSWHIFEGGENTVNGENADTLRFSSRAHITFGPKNESEIGIVTFYVEEDEEAGSLVLLRSDELLMGNEPGGQASQEKTGFPVCEGLASVDFKYFDFEGESQETWSLEDEETLPGKVSITLEFIDPANPDNRYRFYTAVGLPMGMPMDTDDE